MSMFEPYPAVDNPQSGLNPEYPNSSHLARLLHVARSAIVRTIETSQDIDDIAFAAINAGLFGNW